MSIETINLKEAQVPASELLFDPNNFRFQDLDGFVSAAEDRFHEEGVQAKAFDRLRKDENLVALKKSILRNGYLAVERIVVRPYKHAKTKWVVVEGNRRLAAVKWILEDHAAGVTVDPGILALIQKLPVMIIEHEEANEAFRASLMGIRHVSGIKQWGGYQRAKLVADMRDRLKLEATEIAERLAMSTQEVNRRYRAFKALAQMEIDEDFGGFAKPALYPIFHEAVSIPVVRSWLDWSDSDTQFKNEEELRRFYELITPTESDDDEAIRPPKITTYSQIRELREILIKPEAKKLLLEPSRSFQEALNVAASEALAGVWAVEIAGAIRALEAMGIHVLKNLSADDTALLNRLLQVVSERLNDHKSLTQTKP
ncbi:MAG: ParB N-terminal domain-containing protein [Candidatus Binatus sp.]|uniref:ParB N-terminal domain-containing protein n=1 Tax=Candidatus Binatus sp. TaxID=2811406 RepID=UPI003D14AE0C